MRRRILILLLAGTAARAQLAPTLPRDADKATVIRMLGWPRGKGAAGDREIWTYDGFEVVFDHDHVDRVAPRAPSAPTRRPTQPTVQNVPPAPRGAALPMEPMLVSPSRPPPPSATVRTPPPTALPRPAWDPASTTAAIDPTTQRAMRSRNAPAGTVWPWTTILACSVPLLIVIGGALIALLRQRRTHIDFNRAATSMPPSATGAGAPWTDSVAARLDRFHGKEVQARPVTAHTTTPLTLDRLRELEWKRFELIVTRYFGASGFRAEPTCIGADGGIDVKLYRGSESIPCALAQCKAWGTYKVGVKPIRELYGVMADQSSAEGYFVTTSAFTGEARAWVANKKLHLIDGAEFVTRFNALPAEDQREILAEAFAGDYRTPTCPKCDVKLVVRSSDSGSFWGCPRYPRCSYTLNSASAAEAGEAA